jgi:hypothetical protein
MAAMAPGASCRACTFFFPLCHCSILALALLFYRQRGVVPDINIVIYMSDRLSLKKTPDPRLTPPQDLRRIEPIQHYLSETCFIV